MNSSKKSKIVRLAEKGDFDKAKIAATKLCKLAPKDPEAWFLLGSVNGAIEDFTAAEYCCRKALKFTSKNPMLLFNLGIALLKQGKAENAIKQFKNTLNIQPQNADAYLEIANAFKFLGNNTEAITNYKNSLLINPAAYLAHHYLAETYHNMGDLAEAVKSYEQAIHLQNTPIDSYSGLASTLIKLFKYDKTIDLLKSNIQRLPVTTCLYYFLAIAYQEQGEIEKSAVLFSKVLDIDNNHTDAKISLASILALQGEYEKAGKELKSILNKNPYNASATIAYVTFASQFGATKEAVQIGTEYLKNNKLNDITKSKLVFALANLYEKQGDLDIAFENYRKGNELKGLSFDETSYSNMFNSLIKTYTADIFEKFKNENKSSINPIFIVGMPRSGTSLAEQIIASHPEVYGAGELPIINRMVNQLPNTLQASAPYPECLTILDSTTLLKLAAEYLSELPLKSINKKYITDKMPLNAIHLGFISLLFPDARIIHCIRDPRDTCLSCYFKNFSGEHPYAYSLTSLGLFYRMYEKLMAHWEKVIPNPIFELSYESIVGNPEQVIRNIVDYCDLDWNDACLNFHQTKRAVATASHSQVRQKMYSSSVGKWRNYEKHLDELFSALRSPV